VLTARRNALPVKLINGSLRLTVDGRTLHHFAVCCKIFFHDLVASCPLTQIVGNLGQNLNGERNSAKPTPGTNIKNFLTDPLNKGINHADFCQVFPTNVWFRLPALFSIGRLNDAS